MADLKLRAKSEGLDRIEREFDGLTTAQQRAILKTSAVGKQFENMEKKAVGAIKRSEAAANGGQKSLATFGDTVKGLATNFAAAGAAGGLAFKGVSALIKQAQDDAENLRRVLKESTDATSQKGQSAGSILLNAGDLAANPEEAQRVVSKLDTLAVQRGRSGAELGDAFAAVRPSTGGATDDQRIQALDIAFKAKQVNEGFDAPGFATAIIKIAQSAERRGEGFDVKKASDTLLAIADKAGLDTNEIGKPVQQLIGGEATGASIEQLGGALAFFTASTGKRGDASIEAILPLITKLAAEDKVKIAGKNVTLEGADPFAKLNNFIERLNKGDFGENKTRAIADLTNGGGGINTQLFVGQIAANLEGFKESLAAGTKGGVGVDQRFDTKRLIDPSFDETVRANEAAARANQAASSDVRAANIERQGQQLEDLLREFGQDPTQSGSVEQAVIDSLTPGISNRGDRLRSDLAAGVDPAELRRSIIQQQLSEAAAPKGIERQSEADFYRETRLKEAGAQALAAGDEQGAARNFLAAGAVDFTDGLQRNEQAILRMAGSTEDLLKYLQLSDKERAQVNADQQKAFAAELAAVMTPAIQTAVASDTNTAQESR